MQLIGDIKLAFLPRLAIYISVDATATKRIISKLDNIKFSVFIHYVAAVGHLWLKLTDHAFVEKSK